jgi:DNA-binding MarR family transcriptional regulator
MNSDITTMQLILGEMQKMRMSFEQKLTATSTTTLQNLTMLQLRACMFLLEFKSQKMTSIAKALNLKTSGATQLVDKLIDIKMVVRIDDPKDRRNVLIELSDYGQKVMKSVKTKHDKVMTDMYNKLNPSEMQLILSLLQKINN